MGFKVKTEQKIVYTTEDGKQFTNAAEAEAHQFTLENQAKIDLAVESYLNKFGYSNRSRQQKRTIAAEFYAFSLAWDGHEIKRTVQDDEVASTADPVLEEKAPEVAGSTPDAATPPAPEDDDDLF